eukprot:749964-Hanusia_phi.AAC.2
MEVGRRAREGRGGEEGGGEEGDGEKRRGGRMEELDAGFGNMPRILSSPQRVVASTTGGEAPVESSHYHSQALFTSMLKSMDTQEKNAGYESYSDLRQATERIVNARFQTPLQPWNMQEQLKAKNDEIALLIYIANCCEVPISADVSAKLAAFMAENVTGGYGEIFQEWLQDAFDKKSHKDEAFQKLKNEVAWLKEDMAKFMLEHGTKEMEESEALGLISQLDSSLQGVSYLLDVTHRATRNLLLSKTRDRDVHEVLRKQARELCGRIAESQVMEEVTSMSELVKQLELSRTSLIADVTSLEQRLASTDAMLRDAESANMEVVSQLLKEQEVTTNLRHVVRNLQEEYQESLQTVSKQRMEIEGLKRVNQQQDVQQQEQQRRLLELEAAVEEGRQREQDLQKSQANCRADLTNKLSSAQQQVEEKQQEITRVEAEAMELGKEVLELRAVLERIQAAHMKELEEILQQHQRQVEELRSSHAREREELERQVETLRRSSESLELALQDRSARAVSPDESSTARNPVASSFEPQQVQVSLLLAAEEPSGAACSEREAGLILHGLREEGVDGSSLRWLQGWKECWSMDLVLSCSDAGELDYMLRMLSGCVGRSKSFLLERSRTMRLVRMWARSRESPVDHGLAVQQQQDWGTEQATCCSHDLN